MSRSPQFTGNLLIAQQLGGMFGLQRIVEDSNRGQAVGVARLDDAARGPIVSYSFAFLTGT